MLLTSSKHHCSYIYDENRLPTIHHVCKANGGWVYGRQFRLRQEMRLYG